MPDSAKGLMWEGRWSPNQASVGVTAYDKSLECVTVTAVIPGLGVKSSLFGSKTLDNRSKVDVKLESRSLEICAEITDKKGKVTKYRYKANKLPGTIDVASCEEKYKKDQVILSLKKDDQISWEVQLSSKGLDQDPSCT
ncbi:hypothetical protein FSP39_020714 [Pinctada imbricata]|uniref:Uncharacterized protein n=1 Tax=Pinctada imbricata TaxID=66713 RepID=A0AA88YQK6_PINIB|nr:hypothetical protein FSP39_020714 [Pinctada imbricata]